MKNSIKQLAALTVSATLLTPVTAMFASELEPGFKSLFNGKDLTGWAGRPQHWSVQDGAITGVTTKDNPAQGNNFLIAKDGDHNLIVSDFELRFSYKFTGEWGNSGLQYRSTDKGNFVVHGYQADFEVGPTFSGILYEEGGRGILCERGKKVVVRDANGKTKIDVVGSLGDSKEIQAQIKTNGWNDYVVIARGNHLQHFINGQQTADVIDEQESKAAKSGILAFQVHSGPPMKVQFRNIRIKFLVGQSSSSSDLDALQGDWVAVEVVSSGEKLSPESLAGIKLNIKGNNYRLETNTDISQGTLKLNQTTSPRCVDVTTQSGDEVAGIYELSEDRLKVCYPMDGGARPTEFKSTEGSSHVLAIYKRKQP
jgi:uncharacterized protein (TIGR03067 family)